MLMSYRLHQRGTGRKEVASTHILGLQRYVADASDSRTLVHIGLGRRDSG
jgi:hypothetical protein